MSEYLGNALFCQQCEGGIVISASSREELRARLEEQGWSPYGTGVTPLAEENAERGEFACKRCTKELVEQRLNRIAREAVESLGIDLDYLVIRDRNSASDFLRIKRGEQTVQIPFERCKTDREMREVLAKRIRAALSPQA